MLRFRAEQPEEFGYPFDAVQTSTALWRVGTDKKLCAMAAELIQEKEYGLLRVFTGC